MKSLRFRLLTASLSLTASVLLASPAMADTLTGATIAGTFTSLLEPTFLVISPFTSPAVVGPGVEFTGTITSPFIIVTWNVDVDLSANGFTIGVTGSDVGTAGNGIQSLIYEISLSGLPSFVQGFALTSYNCDTSVNPGCLPENVNGLRSNTFSNSAVTLDFNTIAGGQTYTFADVTAPVATPEPTTLALFGTGCLSMLGVFRVKRK